ncbi:MAG: PqqD family peptide modification chaperone [Desulfobacterales bacterium]|nr:PqqD family peptide modification chaperone [Desulfobacterales bacterium]
MTTEPRITIDPAARPRPRPDIFFRAGPDGAPATLVRGATERAPALRLNETGVLIWSLCDGVNDFSAILAALEARFGHVPGGDPARDLEAFIHDLVARRFLWLSTIGDDARPPPPSRRVKGRPRPLFIMGNKRSGTTLLVKLLNLHPRLFITNESDIVWILHQAQTGEPDLFERYEWDDCHGMNTTLSICRPLLRAWLYDAPGENPVARAFFRAQHHLMAAGARGLAPCRKRRLAWIGDKKPVQHADPALRPFMRTHFPDARYIHIVRDPRAVVPSMLKAAREWGRFEPRYWREGPEALFERWAIHEEWALRAKSSETSPIHTLRLEDLCADPTGKMIELFDFLHVKTPGGIEAPILDTAASNPNQKHEPLQAPASPGVKRMMKIHGYL